MSSPFADDGRRDELVIFIRHRDENAAEMADFFKSHGQYWKLRVFFELLWEYESRQLENPQETKAP